MSQRLALVRLSSHLGPRSSRVSIASVRSAEAPSRLLHTSTKSRLHYYSYALSKCSQSSLTGRRRMFHCAATPCDAAKAAAAEPSPEAPAQEVAAEEQPKGPTPFEKEVEAASTSDDEVPEWQNPRHHNNPDKDRVFEDEFGPDEEIPVAPLPPFDDGSGKVSASPELHGIAEEIINMSMIEVNELCNRIAEHFGIEEREGGPMMGAGDGDGDGGDAEEAAPAEERTAFDLKLVSFDAKAKIKVIKEVRSMAGLGLKEAKEMVEGAPKTVMKEIKMEEAEELKAKLEALGAVVEIV